MKITTKGRYAVRAMVDLACHSQFAPVALSQISKRQNISSQYLEQLFVKLKKGGLVKSTRGVGGGYRLVKDPGEITIKDIFMAVKEEIFPVSCMSIKDNKAHPCNRLDRCISHMIWKRLGVEVSNVLESMTLQEICEMYENKRNREGMLKHNYTYNI